MDAALAIYRRSNCNNYLASNDVKRMIACDKIERNAEKAVVVYLKVLFRDVNVGTEKTHENLSQDRSCHYPGRDFTQTPP
jgi:hypothetical protein